LVFAATAIAAAVLLAKTGVGTTATSVLILAGLSLFSYRAAIASARGYGVILETIANLTRE
jgi:hypothetical protein